ncbi:MULTISPECIES: hypothetical protein [Streptomyces]|uniref:Uncharacterized protein n=1 Tax=Streptomyces griseiscabiei TaxID=2993540 RepID=A0ABU4L1Y0_9ACTN|nr:MULTISPECIES: hypothetical protein [Streptomyces]MBZ3906121.1 hypothetical protein [Streptomyces griseiscabiei]MDX2909755.1 hypothetical protein [Streptomyces griseiscabiei]
MGNWCVMVQYAHGETYRTEFVVRGQATKEEALKALRAAVHTYVPSRSLIEKRRQVYRFTDQEAYLVVIKGKLTEWECTLRVMELISDSTDPAVAERARPEHGTTEAAEGPQDRIPPGY